MGCQTGIFTHFLRLNFLPVIPMVPAVREITKLTRRVGGELPEKLASALWE
jgi:hypothetical protein